MADLELGLFIERLLSSGLLLLLTLSLTLLRPPRQPNPQQQVPSEIVSVLAPVRTPRRTLIVLSGIALAVCWIADAGVIAFRGLVEKLWEPGEQVWKGEEVAVVLNFLAWTGVVGIGVWKENYGREIWTSGLLKVITLLAGASEITTLVMLSIALDVFSLPSRTPEYAILGPALHFGISLLRLLILIPLLPILYPPTRYVAPETPSERTGLLATQGLDGAAEGTADAATLQDGYGTIPPSGNATPSPRPDKAATEANGKANGTAGAAKVEKEEEPFPSWTEMTKRLWKLVPYLWPARVWYLQALAGVCIFLLLAGRAVNVLLPITLARLIDALTYGTTPWTPLLQFVGLRLIQGGVLDNVRSALWLPVMQYSDREMSFLSFDHLMNLSLSFHNKRKLGEVTRILNRGSSVNTLFEVLLYMVIPTILDLGIAVVYILFFFGADIAAILALVMCLYGILSVLMTRWRTRMRRRMNEQDTITRGIHTDCLMNYETVKYFVGEEHESQRYRESVKKYQTLEYRVYLAANLTGFLQSVIITLGMTLGSLIIVRRITLGQATQALFVVFITYLSQLTGPLMSLGAIYRHLNQMLVDAEKLIQLLNEDVDVQDKEGAEELVVKDGVIEFENVSFSYDDRKGMAAVRNVSFTVPKGKHVALVGESGSGKSTLMRLLFRFYDLKEGQGRILVDGKDLRDVTQKSLRRNIGVVPQDSVLFNENIGFNIGYGKFDATQEEIEAAARAAQMHERIMSFPDQYQTKVGERGVKLSGGEKQRVAIARTLLKDPPILLLDEATSALDTATERDIQKALNNLVKGRSSLTIAHRLSTIANADIILVMKDGEIIERGSHRELLKQNGAFAQMWAEHVMSEGETYVPVPSTSAGTPIGGSTAPSIRGGVEGYQIGDVPVKVTEGSAIPEVAGTAAPPAPSDSKDEEPSAASATADSANAAEASGEVAPAKPASYAAAAAAPPAANAPIAFPRSSVDESSQPGSAQTKGAIAFPSSASATIGESSEGPRSPGASGPSSVTFAQSTSSPPSRAETPEPGKEPRRKRLSSQNIGRMVRRISIGPRKASGSDGVKSPVEEGKDKKKGKK